MFMRLYFYGNSPHISPCSHNVDPDDDFSGKAETTELTGSNIYTISPLIRVISSLDLTLPTISSKTDC